MVLAEQVNKLIKYFQNQLITFVNIGLQSRLRIQKSVQGAPLSEVASFLKKMIILSAAIWTRFLIFQVKIYISFGKWPKTRNCGSRCSSRGWWGLTFTPTADFGDFVFFPIFIFLKKIEISFNHTALILKLSTVSLVAGWQLIAQFADGHVTVVSAQRMNEFCFVFCFLRKIKSRKK